jgi:hypothetical protein
MGFGGGSWVVMPGSTREEATGQPHPQPVRGANIGYATGKGPRGRAALRADIIPLARGGEVSSECVVEVFGMTGRSGLA